VAFPVVIGGTAQTGGGFAVELSDESGGSMLDFTLPSASTGSVLMVAIVRNATAVSCSDATWTQVADTVGASGIFLDGWVRTVDGGTKTTAGYVVSFLSETEQELQGTLIRSTNATAATLVYDVQHGTFTADTTPTGPAITALQAFDTIACL
jgi:regulator of RNase E activity RraA